MASRALALAATAAALAFSRGASAAVTGDPDEIAGYWSVPSHNETCSEGSRTNEFTFSWNTVLITLPHIERGFAVQVLSGGGVSPPIADIMDGFFDPVTGHFNASSSYNQNLRGDQAWSSGLCKWSSVLNGTFHGYNSSNPDTSQLAWEATYTLYNIDLGCRCRMETFEKEGPWRFELRSSEKVAPAPPPPTLPPVVPVPDDKLALFRLWNVYPGVKHECTLSGVKVVTRFNKADMQPGKSWPNFMVGLRTPENTTVPTLPRAVDGVYNEETDEFLMQSAGNFGGLCAVALKTEGRAYYDTSAEAAALGQEVTWNATVSVAFQGQCGDCVDLSVFISSLPPGAPPAIIPGEEPTEEPTDETPGVVVTRSAPPDDEIIGLPLWAFILICVAIALLLLVICALLCRKRSKGDAEDRDMVGADAADAFTSVPLANMQGAGAQGAPNGGGGGGDGGDGEHNIHFQYKTN